MSTKEDLEEKQLEELRLLVNSKGWKLLMREFEETIRVLESIEGIKTLEDLYFTKGQVVGYKALLTLSDTLDLLKEELNSAGFE